MKLTVAPPTPDRWSDLEAVFNAKGCSVARGGWCMAYRLSGSREPLPPGAYPIAYRQTCSFQRPIYVVRGEVHVRQRWLQ
jgi:hypothetical protein